MSGTNLQELKDKLDITDEHELFKALFQWWFHPNQTSKAAVASQCDEAYTQYCATSEVPDFFAKYLENREVVVSQTAEGRETHLKLSILQLIVSGMVPLQRLSDEHWVIMFTRWYGNEPQNPPDTPTRFANGCKDPRWSEFLNTLKAARCHKKAALLYRGWHRHNVQ